MVAGRKVVVTGSIIHQFTFTLDGTYLRAIGGQKVAGFKGKRRASQGKTPYVGVISPTSARPILAISVQRFASEVLLGVP